MKLSSIAVPALLAITVIGGCYSPQPTTLYRSDKLPETHWYALEASDSRIKVLPAALQNSITQQRQEVAAEMQEKGAVSTEMSEP